ncbi:hypothetical protein [Luteolibacter soli]|uniref:Spondin domain-containing protein n=1 Tax=Luteolibacter soli TaxID=3135280 RepID=A0ABU9AWG6_9BACT
MKKLLLRAFALLVAVLPFTAAQAAAPKPPVLFGDYAPGKTFTFTVTTAQFATTTGFGGTPVLGTSAPAGIPNFTVGQQVTFVIGKKGELIGPGFKIGFLSGAIGANAYINKPKKGAQPTVSSVHKNTTTNEPTAVDMTFFTFKLSKRIPTVTMTTYILQ